MNMKCGYVEYKMSRELADSLIKENKGKKRAQDVLCDYVNTEYGLLGLCVRVIVFDQ